MSTVAKAVAEITGTGNTKIRKSSSELCTFLGIPRHSRSEVALILSKFIKLYNFRVLSPYLTHHFQSYFTLDYITCAS